MAGKINYRFVALLSTLIVVCTLGVVGLWYLVVQTDPSDAIVRGDTAFEEQKYSLAAVQYSKALSKRKDDISVILRYAKAVAAMPVADMRGARDSVQQLQSAYQRVLELSPGHPEALEGLMQLYIEIGRDLGDFDAWNQMVRATGAALKAKPDLLVARQYRGIAQVNRMESLNLSDDELNETREDLETALEAQPANTEISAHLVQWYLGQARRIERSGTRPDVVEQYRARALEVSNAMIEHGQNDPQRMLYHLRTLGVLQQAQEQPLFEKLTARLHTTPEPVNVVLAAAERLSHEGLRPSRTTMDHPGVRRAEELLRAAIAAHPKDYRLHCALGRTLTMRNQREEAKQLLKTVTDAPLTAPGLRLLANAELQRRALTQYADLLLTQAQEQPTARDEILREIQGIIRQIESVYGRIPQLSLLEGKMDMVRGEWGEALVKLDQASAAYKDLNPEALLFSATARIKLGEFGAAVARLERLLEVRPDYLTARHELMRLHLQLAQFDQAKRQIDAVLRMDPQDFEARRCQAMMLARLGQTDLAIAALEQLDPEKHPSVASALAQLYVNTGQPERANKVLAAAFEHEPSNPQVLAQLLSVTSDPTQAQEQVEAARAANMSDDILQLLEDKAKGRVDDNRVAAIEILYRQEPDPFKRQVKLHELYTALAMREKAAAALAEAAKINPDHPHVIEAQFTDAVAQKNFDAAGRLAQRGKVVNADLAQGNFLLGRLQLARGETRAAVESFTRALALRDIYSEGWKLLGDAQLALGDSTAAANAYQRAVDQNPANFNAIRGLVVVLTTQKRHDVALATLRQAVKLGSEDPAMVNLYLTYEQEHGDPRRALAIRQHIAQLRPGDANNQRAMAVLLARLNETQQATQIVNQLVNDEGDTAQNIYTAATVRAIGGDVAGAQRMLIEYVTGLGDNAREEHYTLLGRFLLRTNAHEQGFAAYRQAVEREDRGQQRASRELADLLFSMERDVQAAELYERILKDAPADQRVAYRYAEALLRLKQPEKAMAVLDQIAKSTGATVEAHLLTALAARQQNDFARSMAAIDSALALQPDRAIIYFERAQVRAMKQADDPAILADLRKAIELAPDDTNLIAARRQLLGILLESNDREQALREMQALLQRVPQDAALRVQLAEMYLANQQLLQLRALLEESEQLFPHEALWPRMQGRLAAMEQRPALAAQKYARAMGIAPTVETLTDLSEQLIAANEPNEALNHLRQHEEMTRQDARLQALRGRAMFAAGFTPQALAVFSHAISLCASVHQTYQVSSQIIAALGAEQGLAQLEAMAQGPQRVWLQMAIAQHQISQEHLDEAISRLLPLEASLTMPAERVEYYRLLGLALNQNHDYAGARRIFEEILKLDSDNLVALNNLAYLLAENFGEAQAALPLATRAAALAPQNAQVLDTLGWVQFHAGLKDQALTTLTQSVQRKAMAINCYHLAQVHYDRGNGSRGDELLDMARRLAETAQDKATLKLINKQSPGSTLY